MAASWAALLKSLGERHEDGKALTAAIVWKEFKRQAGRSNREDVKRLAEVGEGMTPEDRARFAVAVMPLLVTLDWPPAWDQARNALVLALEGLVEEVHPTRADGLPALFRSQPHPVRRPMGYDLIVDETAHRLLSLALHTLRRPCPPSELGGVAVLCSLGAMPIGAALAMPPETPLFVEHPEARARALQAFERYAHAARAMNGIAGLVLFRDLDLSPLRVR